jgi:hypothetical protein
MMRLLGDTSTGGGIAGITYEVAMRAVGQDLMTWSIESLEITVEGNAFVAQGFGIAAGRGERTGKEPARESFARRYSAEDIKRLDELGMAQQSKVVKTPDASSLAESLRTIGRVLDSSRGQLIKLSKGERQFTLVYKDEKGQAQRQEFLGLSVYKSQQEALSLRGKKKDIWDDSKS